MLNGRLSELALGLLTCLCDTFTAEGRPVCHCALFHGQTMPPADWCACDCPGGEGQAWVRVNGMQAVHASQGTVMDVCPIDTWRIQFEIGVYRCVNAALEVDGTPPHEAESNADALNAYRDAEILQQVVRCCQAFRDQDAPIAGIRIDGWDPIGPSGNCAGGALRFVVEI